MTSYIISFILCSGLLLAVYHLFLSNENLYRFNRFYLLLSLVFSMIIPAIRVQIPNHIFGDDIPMVERVAVAAKANDQVIDQPISQPVLAAVERPLQQPVESVNYMLYLLFAGYIAVAAVLVIRFALNLYRIKQKVNKSNTQDIGDATLVLVNDDVTPHSFLNYIFINKGDFQNGSTEPEIICHERAHVRQWHSVDVIAIELLQVIFWFNPFIPFYRKAIQLNHEFLADEAVVHSYEDTPAYQHLLLAKAQQGHSLYLTSQFNYLTIKKRLIMMTKNTSSKMATGKKLALLPVLAAAGLLFCHKVMAYNAPAIIASEEKPGKAVVAGQETPDKPRLVKFATPAGSRTKRSATDAPQSVMNAYQNILKKYNIEDGYGDISTISAADTAAMRALFIKMSERQQDGQVVRFSRPLLPAEKNTVSIHWLTQWQKDNSYGVWVDGKRIKNEDLATYKASDFDNYKYSRLSAKAIENDGFKYQIDLMTKPYYADYYKQKMAYRPDRLESLTARK